MTVIPLMLIRGYRVEAWDHAVNKSVFWETFAYDARDAALQWNVERRHLKMMRDGRLVPIAGPALKVLPTGKGF